MIDRHTSKRLVHSGTSGWHYKDWTGPFYPQELSTDDFLRYYAGQFHTVEINNTFYQLPKRETIAQWRDSVSPGFIFAVKASRYITHMKKLKDPEKTLSRFLAAVEVLDEKVGPILFQLPPRWKCNLDRLDSFLRRLPDTYEYAFEFRDLTWLKDETYSLLAEYRTALCIYDLNRYVSPKEITSDFVYIRLHGPDGPYRGQYDVQTLAGWAGAISTWTAQGKRVFCYFDNDEAGYAAEDALHLQNMVGDIKDASL